MNNSFLYSVDGDVATGGAHAYVPGSFFRYLRVLGSDALEIL